MTREEADKEILDACGRIVAACKELIDHLNTAENSIDNAIQEVQS